MGDGPSVAQPGAPQVTGSGDADWISVKRILADALALPGADRSAFLDAACSGDHVLRREIEVLLAEHETQGPFDAMGDELRALVEGRPPLAPGDRVGGFRIVRALGQGGMGSVYLGEREGEDFDQLVAIKLVERGLAREELEQRLRAERRILAALDHPGIARFLDGGITTEGQPYIVMEYVEGTAIDAFADGARLGVEERLGLFRSVLDAVQYAHQHLIVHQDIKPSNILVRTDGTVKLLDFGVARLMGEESGRSGTISGGHTPGYASPEQMRGEPATLASDVFSLGVLLHVLLTGVRPPSEWGSGPSSIAVPEAAARARGTTARRLRSRLAGDIDAIVLKALATNPADRYSTAQQFESEVRAIAEVRPVEARDGGWRYRASRFILRNRLPVGAAAALVVTLVSGLVATATQARTAAEQARVAARERDLSQQVSELLIGMFEVADPGVVLGESITAREILDRAVDEVDRTLVDQPAAHARMLHEIGRIYHNLGLDEPATNAAERSLELYRGIPDPPPGEVTEVMRLVAEMHAHGGNHGAAVDVLDEVLATERRGLPDTRLALAATLSQLAGEYRGLARYEEAEATWTEALELMEGAAGNQLTAEILYGLALSRHDQGDFAGAEEGFRDAVARLPASHPDDDEVDSPYAARSRHRLGQILMVRGENEESQRLLEEALAIQNRLFAPDHADRLATLKTLATVLVNDGRQAEALPLIEETLELETAALGDDHVAVAGTRYLLGGALLALGREVEAAPILSRTIAVYDDVWGPGHPALVAPTYAVSVARFALGDVVGAHDAALRSSTVARANFGDDHPFVVQAEAQRGRTLYALGMVDSAEVVLRGAVSQGLTTLGPTHEILIRARVRLGTLLWKEGRLAEAEGVLGEAVSAAVEVEGQRGLLRADAEYALGETLAGLGRIDEARRLLASSLSTREAVLPPDHRDVATGRAALARIDGIDRGVEPGPGPSSQRS